MKNFLKNCHTFSFFRSIFFQPSRFVYQQNKGETPSASQEAVRAQMTAQAAREALIRTLVAQPENVQKAFDDAKMKISRIPEKSPDGTIDADVLQVKHDALQDFQENQESYKAEAKFSRDQALLQAKIASNAEAFRMMQSRGMNGHNYDLLRQNIDASHASIAEINSLPLKNSDYRDTRDRLVQAMQNQVNTFQAGADKFVANIEMDLSTVRGFLNLGWQQNLSRESDAATVSTDADTFASRMIIFNRHGTLLARIIHLLESSDDPKIIALKTQAIELKTQIDGSNGVIVGIEKKLSPEGRSALARTRALRKIYDDAFIHLANVRQELINSPAHRARMSQAQDRLTAAKSDYEEALHNLPTFIRSYYIGNFLNSDRSEIPRALT